MVNIKAKLLDKNEISKTITRLSHEIIEKCISIDNIAVVGIRTRGDIIARRILSNIKSLYKKSLLSGTLDVTFYRDDFRRRNNPIQAQKNRMDFIVENKNVIFIDDVLYTGRTIRAALNELFSFGRPSEVKLGVLVDRGHREVPIKADFVGKNFPTSIDEHVHVLVSEVDKKDEVNLVKY